MKSVKIPREIINLMIIAAIILAFITQTIIAQYNPRFGEILAMQMVHPVVAIIFILSLTIMHQQVRRALVYEENEAAKVVSDEEFLKSLYRWSSVDDLYLTKSIRRESLLAYQIRNRKGAVIWSAQGKLDQGGVRSIRIASATENSPALRADMKRDSAGYLLTEGPAEIGVVEGTARGLEFRDSQGKVKYTATLEEVDQDCTGIIADWALTLDTGTPFSREKKECCFLIRKEEAGILGKYFWALDNLDLTYGKADETDKKMAVLLSILIDIHRWAPGLKKFEAI